MNPKAMVLATLITTCFCAWQVLVFGEANAHTVALSEVISVGDLDAEVRTLVSALENGIATRESFQDSLGKMRLGATQLAVLSQALAEYEGESKLKPAAPALRDAAMRFARTENYDDARSNVEALRAAMDGKAANIAKPEIDWAALAKTRPLMDSLRERTDHVRKSLRRSKDPIVESRHAAAMAVLALAVAAHADEVKSPDDRPHWRSFSMEFQREMTQTAAALRTQDSAVALEHFTAAQAACDSCHEKFKR